MKQPSTKEKTRMLLTGIWRNHQSRFMDLVGELEELAVGLLLEMPGNKFKPRDWLGAHCASGGQLAVSYIKLTSLRKDPRIQIHFKGFTGQGSEMAFDDTPLEDREAIVGRMIEQLEEDNEDKQ